MTSLLVEIYHLHNVTEDNESSYFSEQFFLQIKLKRVMISLN